MKSVCILWRRLDRAGHDVARLGSASTGPILEGAAVFAEQGQPCHLNYAITCDASWRTVSAKITGWLGALPITMEISVDSGRRWVFNGAVCSTVQGCEDVDLSFSPATNVLPIRRLQLDVGKRVPVRAAWVRFPECTLEPLDQVYERVSETTYRYETGAGAFMAMLEVNAAGFVKSYQNLWLEVV